MKKQKIFELRWKLEKKVMRTIIGISVFSAIILSDLVDTLEDVVDGLQDILYDIDILGLSSRQAGEIAEMAIIYLMVVGIDRLFTKVFPWLFTKFKKQSTQTEVSE